VIYGPRDPAFLTLWRTSRMRGRVRRQARLVRDAR
jgi:hypothetical protein